jgi:8-oxo-dGTP pyrophosphatase MutT (NUDIX family)/nucleoside 2-deoxyribosyltransferase
MQIIYTGEEVPEKIIKSIFLAGPSLRPNQLGHVEQWRQDACQILNDIGFDGVVFSPENRDNKFLDNFDYDDQVEWEDKCLNVADCIVFWVPRDLSKDEDGNPKLPAFTTNVEWGAWCDSGKVVFGAPEKADKIRYLEHYADFYKAPIAKSLTETLRNALEMVGEGAERVGGERFVPLFIWNTPSFQSWYKAQTGADNELRHAELLYNFRPKYGKFVFLWILKVAIYVAAEDRIKDNEFVLSRPDISSVVLWKEAEDPLQSKIAIIKEFRSPASTEDAFIREVAGGSSPKPGIDPRETAAEEIHEETGLMIDLDRLEEVISRQMFGTLSAHKSNLYSYQLSDEELKWLESQKDIVHGNVEETERTFIEIYTVQELLNNNDLDWSNIGMILSVVYAG